ncbi:Gfo/Idh/MocA family oxidoreductase [Streptomyces sp. NBC_01732]|uniref:Gfo/Idh/MocA family protein n=1 Tax=unclassified Streptomyces TaxID=2593676 RepID=UPI000FA4DC32|nr:Gfo/Idh/MocA family oxidoreductase [Streptomyces sp. ADI95-17]RPK63813.1 1,5-anhydro-D-fructose reductase [Streptomyces sp. ADI95-17]WSG53996.1 Gfo/Idh/MocA family oxidoreductase [Streptomyces sp. NBC_01732]
MRIGIVGTDNSHVDQIVRHLNGDGATGDARVVALSGGRGRRNVALAATGGIAEIVDEPAALIGLVDAVVVADRDGANHRQQAIPLLAAGLPVFVDKPLSRTVADARAMIDTARAHNAPLNSSSALRWIPDTEALVARSAQGGTPQLVVVSGPADPDGDHGGIFFYGIHAVDIALRLAPGEISGVRTDITGTTVVASFTAGDTRVVVNLVRPGSTDQIPFHAMTFTRQSMVQQTLAPGADYCVPGLEAFLEMARTGTPPIGYGDLLRPIEVLESVATALREAPAGAR